MQLLYRRDASATIRREVRALEVFFLILAACASARERAPVVAVADGVEQEAKRPPPTPLQTALDEYVQQPWTPRRGALFALATDADADAAKQKPAAGDLSAAVQKRGAPRHRARVVASGHAHVHLPEVA